MFNNPYDFQFLGRKESISKQIPSKLHYRFIAKKRSYFVTLEVLHSGIVAIKYCDVKDKGSHNAYKKIFNDDDAFRVITTCLFIMLEYWKKSNSASFAFYAVPREWKEEFLKTKKIPFENKENFVEVYKKTRFRIYNYAMVNLFPPTSFLHVRDTKNCLYVLINKLDKNPNETMEELGNYLLKNCDLIFEPDEE